jgi:pimeloyl-ACP methyl ester carboxylesterase
MQPDASAAAELTQLLPRGRPIFESFSGDPEREYYVYVPASAGQNAGMAVLIHGISCNAAEQILRFVDEAELRGIVLVAPLFERTKYGKYQQVIDRQTGIRSDLALLEIVERVAKQTGADDSKFNLFGFSGGSQFAHRFAMLHPDRVASCVCASAGWYTFPDGARCYPQGIGSHPLDGGCFDPVAIGLVPIHVLVGERDIAQDSSVRSSRGLVRRQGETRLERAERWYRAMQQWALHPASTLSLIPKAGHRFGVAATRRGLAALVFERFNLTQ